MRTIIQLEIICLVLTACGSSDPTFMGVCETDGTIYLPAGNDQDSKVCPSPETITWPSLPLVVDMDPDIASDYSGSVDEAIGFWNGELDITAFTTKGTKPVVHVVIGDASAGGDGATSFYRDEAGALNATIEVRQPADVTSVYYIIAHELGHSLGLCHDPDDFLSIMYPELDFTWDGTDQSGEAVDFRTILVTGADHDAIRGKYK